MNDYNNIPKEQLVYMLNEIKSVLENSYNESEARSKAEYGDRDFIFQLIAEAGYYRGAMSHILNSILK